MNEEKHIHLIGICGTAMASLAGMLKHRGFHVTGSDAAAYPPMSDFLRDLGIPVAQPFAERPVFPPYIPASSTPASLESDATYTSLDFDSVAVTSGRRVFFISSRRRSSAFAASQVVYSCVDNAFGAVPRYVASAACVWN